MSIHGTDAVFFYKADDILCNLFTGSDAMSDWLWLLLVVGDVGDLDLSVGLRRAVRERHDAFDADVRL